MTSFLKYINFLFHKPRVHIKQKYSADELTLGCGGSILIESRVCACLEGVGVQARPPHTLSGLHVLGNVELLQQQNLGPGGEGISEGNTLLLLPRTQ